MAPGQDEPPSDQNTRVKEEKSVFKPEEVRPGSSNSARQLHVTSGPRCDTEVTCLEDESFSSPGWSFDP